MKQPFSECVLYGKAVEVAEHSKINGNASLAVHPGRGGGGGGAGRH